MMIFFFTVVTVILPALVLAGLIAFAVRDAREHSTFNFQHSTFNEDGIQSSRSDARAPRAPRRIFNFLSAKLGKCS